MTAGATFEPAVPACDQPPLGKSVPATQPTLRVVTVTRGMLRGHEQSLDAATTHSYAGIGGDYKEMLTTSAVGPAPDNEPAAFLAALGDTPIGRISVFPGLFHAGNAATSMYWCSGLDITQEYRQTGAGLLLMLKLRSLNRPIGVVGVSRQALPLYTKLGWTDLAATRYLLVLKAQTIVHAVIGAGLKSAVATLLASVLLHLHRGLLGLAFAWAGSGMRVEACEALSDQIDVLISSSLSDRARFHRSAVWVNWCMRTGPKTNERRLHLVRSRAGEPLGYFMESVLTHGQAGGMAFANLRLASLRDWISFDQNRLSDLRLILLAMQAMLQRNADAIEVCVPEADVGRRLKRLGFLTRGALHLVFRSPTPSPVTGTNIAGHQVSLWWRPADGDGFIN